MISLSRGEVDLSCSDVVFFYEVFPLPCVNAGATIHKRLVLCCKLLN